MTPQARPPALAFRDSGQGPPILLLHGIPGQSDTWATVQAGLSDGFRTIAPDLVGFGKSPAGDLSLNAQADAVAALLASLKLRTFHIVAHDFGVPVAMTLLRRYPRLRPLALVAMATNLFPDTPIPAPLQAARLPALRYLLWPMLGTVAGARLAARIASGSTKPRPYAMATQSARSTFRVFVRSLTSITDIYAPVEATARQLRIPTIVLWGAKDPFFSAHTGRRTAEALHAEFRLLDDVGHFVPEETPQAVIQAVHDLVQAERHRSPPSHSYQGPVSRKLHPALPGTAPSSGVG